MFRRSPSRSRRSCRPARAVAGVGLLELVTVLLLVAVLATMAHPTWRELRAGAATRSTAEALHGALHYARSHALLQGQPTVLCLSVDGERCAHAATPARGWIIFVNRQVETPPQRAIGEPLLRSQRLGAGLRLFASRQAVTYWPVSRAGTTATFTVCAPGARAAARSVIVSQIGRPRARVQESRPAACEG